MRRGAYPFPSESGTLVYNDKNPHCPKRRNRRRCYAAIFSWALTKQGNGNPVFRQCSRKREDGRRFCWQHDIDPDPEIRGDTA